MPNPKACFVYASGQNAYFTELLDALRAALEESGVATESAIDHFPPAEQGTAYVCVPHEYMPFTLPAAHPTPEQLRRSVAVMTEQPGTSWFEKSAAIAAETGAVVEINPSGLVELERRGVSARSMPLGYVAAWDRWGGDDSRPRPVDYTFMGQFTHRRELLLGRGAPYLHRWRGSIHLARSHAPHTRSSASFLAGVDKWDHLAGSRALLNVHRDDYPYFEWLRVVEAITNGCVLVSEHSVGFEPLVPGEHFLSAAYDRLPLVLHAALTDDGRLAAMRRAAYELVRERLPMSQSIAVLAEAVEELSRVAAPGTGTGSLVGLPTRLPPRKPSYLEVAEAHDEGNDAAVVRSALKQLVLGQRELGRRLGALEQGATPREPAISTRGPYSETSPRITVVTALYNYEGYIDEALASVGSSERRDVEVVVVDDGSTDGSLQAVDAALEAQPWLAAKVVSLPRNRGLPVARNTAFEHARGEYVFVLDADNAVYPKALGVLADALDAAPEAAFAYGLLAMFGPEGGRGIFSWPAWEPYELRFGNYIDAMAMIRHSAWSRVGGYREDPRLHGWEDLAMWCELAQRGMGAVRVPDILGRYRKGRHSMLAVTDIDHAEVWGLLVERYPILTLDGDPDAPTPTPGEYGPRPA